jgi:hypothetical protein
MKGSLFIAAEVTEVRYQRQRYRLLRIEPYTRRDGTETSVAVWQSVCSQCRGQFECTTPALTLNFKPARRCPDCRTKCKWSERFKADNMPLQPGQRPFAPIIAYQDESE